MCSVCLQSPCSSRCPNASEPEPVYMCIKCNEGIFSGDKYFDSYLGPICEDCLDDMTVKECLEYVGETLSTAEKEEF